MAPVGFRRHTRRGRRKAPLLRDFGRYPPTFRLKAFFRSEPGSRTAPQGLVCGHKVGDKKTPVEVKQTFRSADHLARNRMCFDLAGNQFRLIVKIDCRFGIVFIGFVGTHRDYDKIDANAV
ncbi:MAG: type II toxin-antitoxin system HigB family toxin [Roseomonas sp.]|nr:type II toxin-antitoxin system HigB family toxin [Roseomonas sp.]MCA3290868.1 type II toxin-antitoxin system HigB family toxin [Roseomonas sp.]MCA3296340.1 type II toxin-antitoxin system HigB family toxin [Roseomonas sp.]